MNALDKYEIKEIDKQDQKEQWEIDSLDSANWALRKINALNKKVAETLRLAEQEHKRIEEWATKELENDNQSIVFFEHKLGEYLLKLRESDPKAKIKTPYGTVSTRKQNAKIEYDEKTIKELKEKGLGDYVRCKEEVNKNELKKILTITDNLKVVTDKGEVIENALVVPEKQNLVVKVVD